MNEKVYYKISIPCDINNIDRMVDMMQNKGYIVILSRDNILSSCWKTAIADLSNLYWHCVINDIKFIFYKYKDTQS